MMNSMSGTTAAIGPWLLALSSTEPAVAIELARRQLGDEGVHRGLQFV